MSSDPSVRTRTALRVLLSAVAGIVAVLATLPYGCDDVEGSSWARCRSYLGNPIGDPLLDTTYSNWWLLVPLAIGIGASALVWWLLRRSRRVALVTAVVVVIAATLAAAQFAVAHFGS